MGTGSNIYEDMLHVARTNSEFDANAISYINSDMRTFNHGDRPRNYEKVKKYNDKKN